jgi:predicted transcriptional regulator
MPDDKPTAELLEHTTRIVAAHVANNAMPAADLPRLIATVHETLAALGPEEAAAKPEPAVSIKQSVKPEYIVCLDDGKKLKMLKRHLKTAYNMTPDDYRKRWGLPRDYPMVAPNYAKQRSALAKKIGLGRKPGTRMKAGRKTKKPAKPKK